MDLHPGRLLAIVNPTAARGRAARRLKELIAIFRETGARVDITQTPATGEAVRLGIRWV